MQHPRTTEEIDAAWLNEVLRGAGVIQRAMVRKVDVHAIGEGVGFLSGRARVAIDYDQTEEGAPATVVVKLPASVKESVDFAESTHAYEREIRFYREVAPRTPIRVPRMYATIMEPADHVYILVMEDLKALTAGDQVAGMSRAQVLAAARTIAPLHALWWNGDQRQALPWVQPIEEQLKQLSVTPDSVRKAWPLFLEDFGNALPPGGRALGERINQHLESILATFVKGARTLVHFDYRADNLFFDDPRRKDPVVVLDWQLTIWGLGAYDLARLTGGSIPPAERGGHHEEIVACWHQGLLNGGVTDYSPKQAWHDYRLSAIIATLNPVLFHYMFKTGGERGMALGETMAERFFSDLIECGAEAVVP
ncbi:MAG: ecdysteroid 22-kinase family protein [Gemmataceae bacterium]|nr:ecdysteroid 22-kinase family protein [Gemmataceae bacterium]